MNLPVFSINERVKKRDFLRVLALLVFSESEEVSFIVGTPAVEEQLIFPQHQLPQTLGLGGRNGCGKSSSETVIRWNANENSNEIPRSKKNECKNPSRFGRIGGKPRIS